MEIKNLHDPYSIKMEQAKKLVESWEPTGLLDDLENEYERNGMAILLQNQANQLIKEATSTGTAASSEEWSGVALPLVRRIFGEISAKDFVSVQPMNLPSGLVFYINFKYGNTDSQHTATDNIHGTTNTKDTDPTGGLYGAGRWGYSINDRTSSATAVVTASFTANDSASFNQSDAYTYANYKKISFVTQSTWNLDTEGVKAYGLSSNSVFITVLPEYTDISASSVIFTALGSDIDDDQTGSFVLHYHEQPQAYDRGDFEYGQTGVGSIPEINLDLNSIPIVAKSRKLKAVWTPEVAQDLNAYHAIDAEAELTAMLSEHIAMEIDLEILGMLIKNANTTEYWSARPGYEWNGTVFEDHTSAYYIPNKSEWYRTLGTKMQKVSNKIHTKTMRGGANFMVCGPDVATVIESMPGYNADTDGDRFQFAMGVEKIGQISKRWTVYKNPYMQTNAILVGFRGPNFLETGAVFSPYIPLIMTPLVYDPDTFVPRKGVMTRYAKKIVRAEFYGIIYVGHLNWV